MPLKICVLGSGSKGNCTLVTGERTNILIDAARLGIKYITARLKEKGLVPEDISGILATHAHSDHVDKTTFRIVTGHQVPLYAHRDTFPAIMRRTREFIPLRGSELVRTFDGPFALGEFQITPIEVQHGNGWGQDAVGRPVAFHIAQPNNGESRSVGFATDLGMVPQRLIEKFADTDVIAIESNHDVSMELKSSRPDFLVNWVISERGHLSNPQAGKALLEILKRSKRPPKAILLAHLSADCNTPELALATARNQLESAGFCEIPIFACEQNEPSPEIEI